MSAPRVAFFPDSFHEVNGVAHTSRHLVAFAERNHLPMLCVRAGRGTLRTDAQGSIEILELPRSPSAIPLERDLAFDPFFARHAGRIERALRAFRPDLIHITGPSELGIAGAYFAWKLRIPLAASWHTNLHEYMAQRLRPKLRWAGTAARALEAGVQAATLNALARFYRLARQIYAPNPPLCALLEARTGRPCRLMQRGVDTALFTPQRRNRAAADGRLVLGYVGRLATEKNVLLLPRLHAELQRRGLHPHWLIVGQGEQEAALRRDLGEAATFVGVLRGEPLAQAYADMDLFVFPSHTDTFGNVVLEALASGVPAIVTPQGGPAHIVEGGATGRIVAADHFAEAIAQLARDEPLLAGMRQQARGYAEHCSWDDVFSDVYAGYASLCAVPVYPTARDTARPQTPRPRPA